jgi:hypothetical protein
MATALLLRQLLVGCTGAILIGTALSTNEPAVCSTGLAAVATFAYPSRCAGGSVVACENMGSDASYFSSFGRSFFTTFFTRTSGAHFADFDREKVAKYVRNWQRTKLDDRVPLRRRRTTHRSLAQPRAAGRVEHQQQREQP